MTKNEEQINYIQKMFQQRSRNKNKNRLIEGYQVETQAISNGNKLIHWIRPGLLLRLRPDGQCAHHADQCTEAKHLGDHALQIHRTS
jgi:hypothetical protein